MARFESAPTTSVSHSSRRSALTRVWLPLRDSKKRDMSSWLVEQHYAVPYDGGTKAIDVSTLRATPDPRTVARAPPRSQTPPTRLIKTTPPTTPVKTPPAKTAPPARAPPAAQQLPGVTEIWKSDGPRKAIGH